MCARCVSKSPEGIYKKLVTYWFLGKGSVGLGKGGMRENLLFKIYPFVPFKFLSQFKKMNKLHSLKIYSFKQEEIQCRVFILKEISILKANDVGGISLC